MKCSVNYSIISCKLTSRKELTDDASEKLNMPHLHPWLCLQWGLAHEATCFYKCLAFLLAHKWGDDYSIVMGWLRCSLLFSLFHSAIQCRSQDISNVQLVK